MNKHARAQVASLMNEALQRHRSGAWREARQLYERILALSPDHPDALHLLGCLKGAHGETAQAIELIGRALQHQPRAAAYHYNLANLLAEIGDAHGAEAHFRAALSIKPDYAQAWNNLGLVLAGQRRLDEAIAAYRQALRWLPGRYADAWHHLGIALREKGDLAGAISAYREALKIAPHSSAIHFNLGNALRATQQPSAAARAYTEALRIDPRDVKALTNLAAVELGLGLQAQAIERLRTATRINPADTLARHSLIMATSYVAEDPQDILRAGAQWAESRGPADDQSPPARRSYAGASRRLRVGYVSADFRQHAAAYWIEPLIAGHDRSEVELVAYANQRKNDEVTARLRRHFDHWVNCADEDDAGLASRIAEDGVDVLVDLSGHTEGNRLAVFAHCPAPVQLTWFGFPGTTGLRIFDARLSDDVIDPVGVPDSYSSEPIERLPRFYAAFRPDAATPETGPAPCLSRGHVTFASLNNFAKVTPAMLTLWAEILRRVPNSRLLVQAAGVDEPAQSERLLCWFESQGVARARIELRGWSDLRSFLTMGQEADIALDPFPFNGGVTTCHSLWMGLPVVTRAGRTAASRVGLSLLGRLDLGNLVANSSDQYVEIGVALAQDPQRLSDLRGELRERMSQSALLDGADLARCATDAMKRLLRRKSPA